MAAIEIAFSALVGLIRTMCAALIVIRLAGLICDDPQVGITLSVCTFLYAVLTKVKDRLEINLTEDE